ncbi:MAG TPA: NUDIX domain-containing protein [Cytophagales bacterium]|nr:NUDIX domain-containing protein [Cytophagales bacterium]
MKYCTRCGHALIIKLIDQKERWCCADDSCGYIYWNNPIPVVAIVVETKDGIVLAHNKVMPLGVFSIITGFLEADESPEYAARRETLEELGLDVQEIDFLGIFPFARANQILIAYHVFAVGEVTLNEELDAFITIQRDALVGYTRNQQFEIQEWLDKLQVLA